MNFIGSILQIRNYIIILFFFILNCYSEIPNGSCVSCHKLNISILKHSKVTCVQCHLGNPKELDKQKSHLGIISIPGNFSNLEITCGNCHKGESYRISKSLMTTNSGMISINRWVFEESKSKDILFGIKDLHPSKSAADSYFSQLCASCHLGNEKKIKGRLSGYEKGGGCLSCHLEIVKINSLDNKNILFNLNFFITGDLNKEMHPGIMKPSNDNSCFNCHSRSGRISLNYNGLAEIDENDSSPVVMELYDGRKLKKIKEDIHKAKGFSCIKCHSGIDVMGDGADHFHKEDSVYIKCETCHKIKLDNHHDKNHERAHCASCHSSWAPNCFGCHISYNPNLESYNHLTNQIQRGRWIEESGEMFIKLPVLGVTKDNKIRPFIPGMKLTIDISKFTGKKEKLIKKNLFTPSFSHTIIKESRTCASCHKSSYALGFGEGKILFENGLWKFISDYKKDDRIAEDGWIEPFKEEVNTEELSARTGSRPLNPVEQMKILNVGICLDCHKGTESWFLDYEKAKAYKHISR